MCFEEKYPDNYEFQYPKECERLCTHNPANPHFAHTHFLLISAPGLDMQSCLGTVMAVIGGQ